MAFVSKLEKDGLTKSSAHVARTQIPYEDYYEQQFFLMKEYLTYEDKEMLPAFNLSVLAARDLIKQIDSDTQDILIEILRQIHAKWAPHDKRNQFLVVYPCEVVLLVMMLCFMSGKHTIEGVVDYWIVHNPELQVLIPNMPTANHIISHETVRNMLKLADEKVLEGFFIEFFANVNVDTKKFHFPGIDTTEFKPTLGLDGQEVKSSYRRGEYSRKVKGAIGVSVYNCDTKTVLGYTTTDKKSNEDKVFGAMFPNLAINGDEIIVADAINTRTAVLNALNKRSIDYLLPIKNNRKVMARAIVDAFEHSLEREQIISTTTTFVSGRNETRTFTLIPAPVLPDDDGIFTRVKTLLKYETTSQRVLKRNVEGAPKATSKVKYYICSLEHSIESLKQIMHSIDVYWSIEQHHNTLDTVMMQDRINASDAKYLSARIGINKIIYNVLTYSRHQTKLYTHKTKTYKSMMDFDCSTPLGAFNILAKYYLSGAPVQITTPKRIPTLFKLEELI